MKRSVGIGVGIAITAILVIIAFTNIDDLVSINIEETTSQISSSIQESASQVEFSNPLQTYEIDSTCELAFMIQNSIEYHEPSPFKSEEGFSEKLRIEFEEKAAKMRDELGDDLYSEKSQQKGRELLESMEQKSLDHIMTYNSINPKLRHSVELALFRASPVETMEDGNSLLNTVYLIQPESYKEDLQCGKQFHERFGDETFKTLKSMFGSEELAMKRYNEIKEIISDVVVTNPAGVYDPEGRMLSEEECTDLVKKRDELKKEIDEHVGKITSLQKEYYANRDLIDVKEEIDQLSNDPYFVKIAGEYDTLNAQWSVGCAPFYP